MKEDGSQMDILIPVFADDLHKPGRKTLKKHKQEDIFPETQSEDTEYLKNLPSFSNAWIKLEIKN